MVTRTPGPFDYFNVTGSSITAAADAPDGHARTLASLADDLELDASRASAATEGDIAGLVAVAPRHSGKVARSLAQKGAFASGCLRMFAAHVDLFDSRVNRLNLQVTEAAELSDLGKLMLEPLGGPQAASSTTYEQLLPRYRRDQAELDDTADQVAAWLRKGPTNRVLHRLIRDGLMSLESARAFPRLVLTSADVYLAMAAEAAKGLVPPEILAQGPDALDDFLTKHHDIAAALVDKMGDPGEGGGSGSALTDLLILPALGVTGGGIKDMLEHTSTAERRRLAMLLPSQFGNNPDAPFDMRAQSNRVRISAQIHEDQLEIKRLQADKPTGPGGQGERGEIDERIAKLRERGKLYGHLLADHGVGDKGGPVPDHRSILYFDPRGDGTMAELHGVIDKDTENVGVYVPGTGHGLDDWGGSTSRSTELLGASSNAAMITWIGGDLPDSVLADAPDQKYAKHAGPLLSDFSHQVRDEMDRNGAGKASTMYLGHSYGGAIVGQAERNGLAADRVLMVEGAGMGPNVHDVDDLHPSNRKTPHYSMTAPGDIITVAQNSGHLGADPDTFGDTVRLQTGRTSGGEPIDGISSHSDVFKKRSDAWYNMLALLNGDVATRRHDDIVVHVDPKAGAQTAPSHDSGGTVKVR